MERILNSNLQHILSTLTKINKNVFDWAIVNESAMVIIQQLWVWWCININQYLFKSFANLSLPTLSHGKALVVYLQYRKYNFDP